MGRKALLLMAFQVFILLGAVSPPTRSIGAAIGFLAGPGLSA